MEFNDKVAVVTGASSGIGLVTSQLLTKHGTKVALVARSADTLKEISNNLPGSLPIAADLSDPKTVRDVIKQVLKYYGRVDILVNNAGRGYDATIENINLDILHDLWMLDVVAPLAAMQAVVPVMEKQGQGAIVNIASGTALMTIPGIGAYSSVKRALIGLSLTARAELADHHISVSIIYPYITDTNFHRNKFSFKDRGNKSSNIYHQGDKPDLVAERILEAIKTGVAEIKVHNWMGR